jgi:hypothetical protein
MSELLLYDNQLIQDYKSFDDILEDYGYGHSFERPNLYDMTTKKYNEKVSYLFCCCGICVP